MWHKLSRKTQILLVALSMTLSSFGLSMIVGSLALRLRASELDGHPAASRAAAMRPVFGPAAR